MAGSYPDVPGYRFVYDDDGTIGVLHQIAGGPIVAINDTDMKRLNQDQAPVAPGGGSAWRFDSRPYLGGASNNYICFIFPEPRDITGYFFSTWSNAPAGGRLVQTSSDTTNGQDGTWTTQANPYVYINSESLPLAPYTRTNIQAVSWDNVRAVRVAIHHVTVAFHFYGTIATSESPDRLRIVDLSDDDITAQLDLGNITQRSSVTRQFKVINNSTTQTASNITVSLDTNMNSDATPSIIGQCQISTDNIAFANAVNIGSLAPGTSSGPMYIRMNAAANAQLGPWSAKIIARAVSWG